MTVTPCHICHNNQTTTTTAHNIIDNVLSRLSVYSSLCHLLSASPLSQLSVRETQRGSFAELRTLAWQDFKVLKIHEIENDEMAKIDLKMKSMGKNLKNLSQIFWIMGQSRRWMECDYVSMWGWWWSATAGPLRAAVTRHSFCGGRLGAAAEAEAAASPVPGTGAGNSHTAAS